jgi:hypothetical protein
MTGDGRSMSREGKAVIRVARKLMFKKIRSELKDQLENEFRADPSMRFDKFKRRSALIHNLGRKTYRDYETERLREETLENTRFNEAKGSERNRVLAEREVDLFQWGPFVVDDEGSVKFNPLTLFKKKEITDFWIHAVKNEYESRDKSRLRKKNFKFNIRLRINFNPLRAIQDQSVSSLITKYRLLFETNHYTDYTHRKIFTNEYELSYTSEDNRAAFFWNFVVSF